MMWPEPCSRMIGSAACVTHSAPNRFVSSCARAPALRVTSSIIAEEAVAGVVDDDVEAAEALVRLLDRGVDRRLVVDVELEGEDVVAVGLDERGERVGVARRRGHPVAALERGLGPDPPEALRCAGYEPDFGHLLRAS